MNQESAGVQHDHLRRSVEAHAEALRIGDMATFASFSRPEALSRLYNQPKVGRLSGARVILVTVNGGRVESLVQFGGSSGMLLRAAWEMASNEWIAVNIELRQPVRSPSFIGRMFRRPTPGTAPLREDLS